MKKTAFTMIEMIFVIVILGIVAGMTFIQVSSVYEDMMQKQNSGELESEAKVVLDQITARLSNSIKDSLVAMASTDGSGCEPVSSDTLDVSKKYILAWVGKSDEANLGLWDETLGDYRPGWSGFVDIDGSDTAGHTYISTKGSKLSDAEKIIDQLIGQQNPYSLSQTTNSPVAIYFAGSGSNTNACNDFFNQTADKMYKVKKADNDDTKLEFKENKPTEISEQYALSHSAYAIARDGTNLYLYSFRPWLGQNPNANATNRKLLGQNVSGFGFKWSGGLFRINVCVSKKTPSGYDIEVCKEKAIF